GRRIHLVDQRPRHHHASAGRSRTCRNVDEVAAGGVATPVLAVRPVSIHDRFGHAFHLCIAGRPPQDGTSTEWNPLCEGKPLPVRPWFRLLQTSRESDLRNSRNKSRDKAPPRAYEGLRM